CVLDPRARKHRPFDGEVIESLRIMQSGDPQDRIMRELRDMGLTGVPTRQIDAAARERLMEQGRILAIDKIVFHADSLSCLGHQVHELARAYNKAHPLRYGLDKEELRQRLKFPHSTSTFNKVLEHIAVSSSIYIRNNLVRADTESIELPEDLAERLETLETMIREAGVLLKREADMSRQWVRPSDLLDSLRLLRDERRIHRIGEDSYIHSDVLASCIGRLRRWFAKSPQISVPEFKDLFGITRRQAIPLLEFLDSRRLTARQENVRVAGSKLRDPS
ncbi:MAG: SelB C-terminal domain-containing protein, partial [Candidatus Krumholzibacteria bacterium]|nr:SelB C-terminal domain-containing protein [Candidatus Krumholzibacteria bacterium]